MKILVTGANGQLGKCIADVSSHYPELEFIMMSRDKMPVDDIEKCREIITATKPGVLINTAAYTAVDKAETETAKAFLINADAVGTLATLCKESGVRFIHVSTDYVFNGNANSPYRESDPVSPVNAYGASKLKGEQLAAAVNSSSVIVRTSWVYSRHGANFVKTMMRLMKERDSISVVSDQLGCPTYAIDLADVLIKIALKPGISGVYHFSNTGPITWYDFAVAIKALTASSCEVKPIPTSAFPTPAKRPAYSVMNNEKICSHLSIRQHPWRERLQVCIDEMSIS